MAEYRLTPRAQRDLDGVFDYTVAHWGVPQAMRYTDRIEAACADSAEAPQQAQICSSIRPGYRRRTVEQHVIYFKPTRYGIAIIRILHQRMDATRICKRVLKQPDSWRPDLAVRQHMVRSRKRSSATLQNGSLLRQRISEADGRNRPVAAVRRSAPIF
jgi:toxin ParE1/3/4